MQEGHLLENFKANMKANQNWANIRYWHEADTEELPEAYEQR
jgi:hypothetical protein